jgi:hypothetical protein
VFYFSFMSWLILGYFSVLLRNSYAVLFEVASVVVFVWWISLTGYDLVLFAPGLSQWITDLWGLNMDSIDWWSAV